MPNLTMPNEIFADPTKLAEAGEKLYQERFKHEYEPDHKGEFIAIDVIRGVATLAKEPEEALGQAQAANPNGLFHLLRIGSAGACSTGFLLSNVHSTRLH
jgi:hypothetical protein